MIKTLIVSFGKYTKFLILSCLFVTLEVLFDILLPRYMGKLIDFGIESGSIANTVHYGLILVAFAAAATVTGILAGRFSARASSGFAKNMRRRIFEKVQTFSFSNIDYYSTSGLVTRMTTDVSNVQMAVMMIIRTVLRAPLMIVFVLISAFSINKQLPIIYLCCIPVLLIALCAIVRIVFPIMRRVFRVYDDMNNVVQENLHGIRVVKSFIREEHESKKFRKVAGTIRDLYIKSERIMALNHPIMQTCMHVVFLLVAWIGAKLIVASGNNPELGMTTGYLMTMFTYSTQILMSVMALSMIFTMITIARASAERITEVLLDESSIRNPEDPKTEVADGSIAFKGVKFSYRGEDGSAVLKDIDLEIASGETVGILGGTGSSKSTLVQLIPRLYDVTEGSVSVGGVDVREYDLTALRSSVAMVLQKNELFSGSIKDNLRWGNENATDEEIVHACRIAQADGFIRDFPDGYDTHIEQGGTNVSGGQKQRLCIARALLTSPKVLILDDSTSAVDTETDAMIRRAFRDEMADVTKLIIAQRISSVQDADKIIVLDEGEIIACGTHEQLLENSDVYREVYESQLKGGEENA